jgi:hypothetical protein
MAYRSSTTASGTGATLSTVVPTGAAIDDIMILTGSIDASGAVFSGRYPTGFTALNETGLTLDGQRVTIAWKRLTAADTGSYTFTALPAISAAWVCQAFAFSGRDTGNPPTLTTAVSNAANAAPTVSVSASTITALTGDDLFWGSAPDVNATGIGNTHTAPAGYTKRQDDELTFTNLCGATKDAASAGATGTVTGTFALTSGAAGWAAWLVRIPVVPSGGGTPQQTLSLTGVGS